MSNPENSVRAYRHPSCRAVRDDVQWDEKIKRANIIRYAARVAEGLPIFEGTRKMMYAVHKDDCCNTLVVIFGTEEDIVEGAIMDCPAPDKFEALQIELQDSGELNEGYLIASQRFTEENQIPQVRTIVESYGFVENTSLLDCGWG